MVIWQRITKSQWSWGVTPHAITNLMCQLGFLSSKFFRWKLDIKWQQYEEEMFQHCDYNRPVIMGCDSPCNHQPNVSLRISVIRFFRRKLNLHKWPLKAAKWRGVWDFWLYGLKLKHLTISKMAISVIFQTNLYLMFRKH